MSTAKIFIDNDHSFLEKIINIFSKEVQTVFKTISYIPNQLIPESINSELYPVHCTAIVPLENGKGPKKISNSFANRIKAIWQKELNRYDPIYHKKGYMISDHGELEVYQYFFVYPDPDFPQLAQIIFCPSDFTESLSEELMDIKIYDQKIGPGYSIDDTCC